MDCFKKVPFWNMAKIQKTREQGDETLLSSSIPGVTTVGFAYLAHTILLWFYSIANLQTRRYFDFRFSIKRLYLYNIWVLELETTHI